MKAHTDLEQSKKLAEILPLESADHHYVRKVTDFMGKPVDGKWSIPKYGCPNSEHANYMVQNFTSYEVIPCWSLAALLDQLEDVICDEDGNEWELVLKKENVQYDIYYLNICGEQDNIELDHFYDDLVDCCYEMILKLKEKDLI